MARGLWSAGLAFLTVFSMAGCLSPGSGKTFDSIEAPEWSAGHTWTFHVTKSARGPEPEESGSSDYDVVMTVFNTTEPFQGEPAYYVKTEFEEGLSEDVFDAPVAAYAKSSLRMVGRAWDAYATMARPMSIDLVGTPASLDPYADPCEGRARIEPVEAHQDFPTPTFPLVMGESQRGTFGEDEDFGFDYVLRVEGAEDIHVAAGDFHAVHISFDMAPAAAPQAEGFMSFHVHGDYWYSPAAEFFVKRTLSAAASGGFSEFGSFRFESASELASFRLDTTPEEPAPVVVEDQYYDSPPLAIVSDVNPSQNVAEAPARIRFALASSPQGRSYDGIKAAPSFPPAASYDSAKYEPHWRLVRSDDPSPRTGNGDVFDVSLDRAGSYFITADLRPRECGPPMLGGYMGTFAPYWEKTWKVSVEPGPTQWMSVGEFPVESYPSGGKLDWTVSGKGADGGYATFTPPGRTQALRQKEGPVASQFGGATGTWILGWQRAGPQIIPGSDTPVAVGDDVSVTLRIEYGSTYSGHVH